MGFKSATALPLTFVAAIAGFVLLSNQTAPPVAAQGTSRSRVSGGAPTEDRVRVIVELKLPERHVPEAALRNPVAVEAQRRVIAGRRTRLLARLPAGSYRVVREYRTIPYVALEVSPAGLAALATSNVDVERVMADAITHPVLAESVPIVQGDQAWAVAYDGRGTMIAILDTGVESTHPFLAGKVVEEACYSSSLVGSSRTFCPNGLEEQLGPGAAAPCPLSDCLHGTHVAGIAAGNGANAGQSFSGVAKSAEVLAVQVFSHITDPVACGGMVPCVGAFTSDIMAGLERVYILAWQHNIASVNVSLAGSSFTESCDDEPYKPIIDNLRSIGIATVAASGNSSSTSSIATPACVSSAVSVGSTSKSDVISWFSNVAPFLSLLAPGESITSSALSGTYMAFSGTSMASPHVAGAWGVIKQAAPSASVSTVLNALKQTGLPINDTRSLGQVTATVPRIRLFQALASLGSVTNPSPVITALSPTSTFAGAASLSLTVTGSAFNAFSVVQWNGAARPTTVVSSSTLEASIPATDLTNVGTAQVSVFTPAPGGGTSSGLTFTISPPPNLAPTISSMSPTSATEGSAAFTLTVNGSGFVAGSTVRWNGANRTTTFVSGTQLQAAIPAADLVTDGTASVTVFTSAPGGGTSSSLSFTITPSAPTLTVSATNAVGGTSVTVTLTNGFGGSTDWLALAATTALNTSYLQYTFVGAGVTTRTWTVAMPAAGGTFEFRLFLNNGYTRAATSAPITVTPAPTALTVDATSVARGATVTATLTGGPGGATDWLALAWTSSPDTAYLQWVYVGAGVTTRTWTVTMPTTPGTLEFRLFLNNGFTRLATSPTVTVGP